MPASETHKVTSDNKNALYFIVSDFFYSVCVNVEKGLGNWKIDGSYTNHRDKHFLKIYTNGKMWIKAESIDGRHTYSFGDEPQENEQ
ncbi:hypothetical protein L1D19_05930 [Vibrio natriegens]|uniref:hypothetical protein n=1 Tax=Vibrio natriegens TaxID=691 RepID=UPI001EFC7BA4|nr:hypothetical protein [Vibrio natriegens]MCG9699671.1 hypothetical protein [Vibrio natriegens]